MSDQHLGDALARIAEGAAGAHEARAASDRGLDVARVRAVARRRRTRFGAGVGLGVVAATAVAVAAVALPGSWTAPAESPDPIDRSSSPPEEPAGPWPTAVTLDGPVPGCGDPMPALVAPAGDPEITIETVVQGGPLVSGLAAEAEVVVAAPAGFRLTAAGPELLLVRDGAVAATTRGPGTDSGFTYTAAETTLTWPGVVLDLTRCGTTGEGAAALEPGAYDAYVVVRVLRDTGGTRPEELVVVGGPTTLTVEAPVVQPPVDTHPPVDDLVVTTAGVGPLTVGLSAATNPGAAMLAYDEDYCHVALDDVYPGDPARWIAAYEPVLEFDYYGGDEMHDPFMVAVDDGVVTRIDLWTDRISTAGGIHLGSTLDDLRTAHPEVVEATVADDWSRAWVLADDAGTLVFETVDWYVEGADVVVGIRVFAPGERPTLHATDSGDVAGTCSG